MSVLRLTIPVGMPDVHPRVRAVSQKLPGILLVLWVLTLPLEFTKRYFPNQVIELSRVVIVLALLTFVAQIVLERREVRLPSTTAMAALAAFLVYAAVSAAVSTSAQGIKTVLAMVAYMAMMLTVFNWTRTSGDHRRVWTALAISAIVLAVVGLALHMTGSYIWNAPDKGILRVNATFGDPNIFARFLGIAIVTSVFLGADLYQRWRPAALWVAAALAATLILPYTYSRAGWVFTLVVLVTAVVIARNRKRPLVLAAMVLAVFGLIALVDGSVLSRGAYLAQNLESPFTHPVNIDQTPSLTFLDKLPLDSVRHYLIGAGLIMFVQHPIFGIGFGAFSQALTGPYAAFVPQGFHTTASHTSIVSILAETGLFGLAIVLVFVVSFVRSTVEAARRNGLQRTLSLAPALAILVIVLESQFSNRLFDEPYLWLFLGLAFAAHAGLQDEAVVAATAPAAARQPSAS
jgi:O-antigen ligase